MQHFKKGRGVEGAIINGNDIIDIIRDTDYEIFINNSIIVNGLDFTRLPQIFLDERMFPKILNINFQQFSLNVALNNNKIRLVTNEIEITNSHILPKKKRVFVDDPDYEISLKVRDNIDKISFHAINTLFSKRTFFNGTVFDGPVVIGTITNLEKDSAPNIFTNVSFWKTIFNSEAHFSKSVLGQANFQNALFKGRTLFVGTIFSGMSMPDSLRSEQAAVEAASFNGAKFDDDAFFSGASFRGNVYFTNVTFNGPLKFNRAKFLGDWNRFVRTKFEKGADFSKSVFCGGTFFRDSEFNETAIFQKASFFNLLALWSADFDKYANFRDTQIRWLNYNSDTIQTVLRNRIDFRKSRITDAHFQNIIFQNDADFSDAIFGYSINDYTQSCELEGIKQLKELKALVFRYVTFESDAYFTRTKFLGNTSFERVNFKKEANFINADFINEKMEQQRFSLSYVKFKELYIKLSQLPNSERWVQNSSKYRIKSFLDIHDDNYGSTEKLEPFQQTFNNLRINFLDQGQLDDANEAYYHIKIAELKNIRVNNSIWQIDRLEYEAKWLFSVLSGYGTNLWRALFWSMVIWVFFAILYCSHGKIVEKTDNESHFKPRLFELPRYFLSKEEYSDKQVGNILFSSLKLSAMILFKCGYGEMTISGKIVKLDFKYVVWLEWAVGYYVLVSIGYTLYNTVPVIHSIVSAVF